MGKTLVWTLLMSGALASAPAYAQNHDARQHVDHMEMGARAAPPAQSTPGGAQTPPTAPAAMPMNESDMRARSGSSATLRSQTASPWGSARSTRTLSRLQRSNRAMAAIPPGPWLSFD